MPVLLGGRVLPFTSTRVFLQYNYIRSTAATPNGCTSSWHIIQDGDTPKPEGSRGRKTVTILLFNHRDRLGDTDGRDRIPDAISAAELLMRYYRPQATTAQ